uniref:Structural protein n=1 Tax=Siphoviridae sp. ctEw721 TaxID=2825400 RepID=A0A8S5TRW9_9CAUD|nr:MAG TPA: structural protein [Siphoviridae sp. ctEw721]
MANYILGDVLTAEAFLNKNGQLIHYFDGYTTTDGSINISVTAEEIRGGSGNRLLGKIFHDTNFGVQITNAMWSMQYLAAQIGEEVKAGSTNVLRNVKAKVQGGALTDVNLEAGFETIAPLFNREDAMCEDQLSNKIVWVKDCNGDVFTAKVTDNAMDGTAHAYTYDFVDKTKLPADGDVCVTYPASATAAEQVVVNAAFAPKEFSLRLTGKLFAGDSCKKSNSKYAGELIIEIPRFQLDGTVDYTFNPTSAVSVALNGAALAYGCTCGGEAEYATISTVLNKESTGTVSYYAKYNKIVVSGGTYKVGEPIIIYMAGDRVMPAEYHGSFKAYLKSDATDKASILGPDGLVKAGTTGAVIVEATADGFYSNPSASASERVHPTVEIDEEKAGA